MFQFNVTLLVRKTVELKKMSLIYRHGRWLCTKPNIKPQQIFSNLWYNNLAIIKACVSSHCYFVCISFWVYLFFIYSYDAFDFHKECSKMRWHRLSLLTDRLNPTQEQYRSVSLLIIYNNYDKYILTVIICSLKMASFCLGREEYSERTV